jgi:hypothetical protein
MGSIGGQESGPGLSQGALRILYSLIKDTISVLSSDGFTQANPSVVTGTPSAVSTTLPANVKRGVLGGSVAFVRPDVGENVVGGAALVSAAYVAGTRPLGLFINDAAGNAYENLPAAASGKCPYLRGGAAGVKIYETQVQTTALFTTGTWATTGATVGTALTYAVGDKLYASVNGLLTNRFEDSYEAQWIDAALVGSNTGGHPAPPDVTKMGTVLAPPNSESSEMFVTLSFIG